MPRPFAIIGIAFYLTLVFLSYLNESDAVFVICLVVFCSFCLFIIRPFRNKVVLRTACFAIVAGCIMFLFFDMLFYKPTIALAGEKVNISGEIISLPTKENGRFYYLIKTDSVNNKQKSVKIRLSCSEPLEAEPYDKVKTEATVYILGNNNEDSLQYYKTTGVYLGAYSFSDVIITSVQDKPIMYHVLSLKQKLLNNVNSLLPNENGGLVVALLLGDKSFLSEKTLSNFRNIGISHIVAISGLNLSIFLLIFLDTFDRIKVNKRIAYALSLFFVLLVMALAGFSPSVLRAGIMLIVLIIGKLINKDSDALNSIGLSVLIIAALNPFGAGYIGLQLSFFATLGIVVMQKSIMKPFDIEANKIKQPTIRRAIKFVFETVTVTIAAFVFTLPTIILTFEKVALISVLSNLMLVYSSTLSMIFGGLAALVMEFNVLAFLSNPIAIVSGLLARYIIKCSELLENVPFSSISTNDTFFKLWLSGALLLVALSIVILKKYNKNYFKLTSTLCLVTLIIGVFSNFIVNQNVTRITVASVGNASATIISKNTRAALIGCGGNSFEVKNICDIMSDNNLSSLDLMIIPRVALTESQATNNITRLYDIKKIIAPELNYDLDFISKNEALMITKNERILLWKGSTIDYLYNDNLSCAYANLEGTTVLFIFYPGCKVDMIPQNWKSADILICRSKPPERLDCLAFGTVVISSDGITGINEVNKIVLSGGNAFTTANGSVVLKSNGNSVYSVGRRK